MSWDHGYYSHASYTSSYFREMAPNWIDLAAVVKGVAPGRPHEGAPFHYLDLGCGTGYGLCLLAALYPEGSFLGVDFLPLHVAKAEALANQLGLENIRFVEADFLALAQDWSPLWPDRSSPPRYDYVVSHGVATWVVPPVQHALLAAASSCLRPGGIFYCSYNCFPGWLTRTALHQLVNIERRRCDSAEPFRPIQSATSNLKALLGTTEKPSKIANAFPSLQNELELLKTFNPQYLSQEYANEGWQPVYVNTLHELCNRHKLTWIGSATLNENFPRLLPQIVREVISQEQNPTVRELLVDIATYKAFRRDLFSRGPVYLNRTSRQEYLSNLRIQLQEAPPVEDYTFVTSYGNVVGQTEAYKAVEEALGEGEDLIRNLYSAWEQPPEALIIQIVLLVNFGRVGLVRGPAGQAALEDCQRVNRILKKLSADGAGYDWFAAATLGQAVHVPIRQQMILNGIEQGLKDETLVTHLQKTLTSFKMEVARDAKDIPVSDPGEQIPLLKQEATRFKLDRLTWLEALGVFSRKIL